MERIKSSIPRSAWTSLRLHIDIAWDGALENDPDCEFIIGGVCAEQSLYTIIRRKLSEELEINEINLELSGNEKLLSTYWFRRAANGATSSNGAKLAKRMLDPNIKLADKEKNLLNFWEYIPDMTEKSQYFLNM